MHLFVLKKNIYLVCFSSWPTKTSKLTFIFFSRFVQEGFQQFFDFRVIPGYLAHYETDFSDGIPFSIVLNDYLGHPLSYIASLLRFGDFLQIIQHLHVLSITQLFDDGGKNWFPP